MVFSGLPFLLLFLPLLLLAYFVGRSVPWRNGVLVVFSLLFYAWGEPVMTALLVAATLLNYLCALAMDRAAAPGAKKLWLLLGVAGSLAGLLYFKYAGFFLDTLSSLLGRDIPFSAPRLPIGISFYTFQILTYTIDAYRGRVPVQRRFFRLLLYVSCFPQLIAGPIVAYGDVAQALGNRTVTTEDFADGMGRFSVGLSKKVLLANACGKAVETLLAGGPRSVAGAWLGAALYMLQIYFDFSAYSDMAIGLGRVLGFRYKENFRYPYVSVSVADFWRRWHISLGSFFREYVYIPLGGNRRGRLVTARNLLIVWGLTGLWHGASWNFVVWGLYYGLWLLLERFCLEPALKHVPGALRTPGVLLVVMVGWILFYHESLSEGWRHIQALVGVGISAWIDDGVREVLATYTVLPLVAAACCLPIVPRLKAGLERHPLLNGGAALFAPLLQTALLLLSLAFLVGQSYNPFIYFRF